MDKPRTPKPLPVTLHDPESGKAITLLFRINSITEQCVAEIMGMSLWHAMSALQNPEGLAVSHFRNLIVGLLCDNDQSPVDSQGMPDAKKCLRYYSRMITPDTLPTLIEAVTEFFTGEKPDPRTIAVYVPTPEPLIRQMLKAADLKPGETLIDPACGDGRVLAIANDAGAKAIGFEIHAGRFEEARKNAPKADVFLEDGMKADFSMADVVFLYTAQNTNDRMMPILMEKCRPGTRIVSHAFTLPGIVPHDEGSVDGKKFFAYRIPEKTAEVETLPEVDSGVLAA